MGILSDTHNVGSCMDCESHHSCGPLWWSGVDGNSPMNQAITQLEFLSPTDFMICTRDDFEQPWIHQDHMGTKELHH